MIILLVTLSVVNLQILTATEPDSPAAMPGLERALLWVSVTGGICILTGLFLLFWLPRSISRPIKELKQGILEIANHNYEKRLEMKGNEEFREVADSFNRMAERLTEYRASTLADILAAKKFLEAIVNSINEPIIGLNTEREILFINNEALNVLNLKRENVIRKSAEELSLKNDLLRRLIRELVTPGNKEEPLKIYADNKESYFKASYIPINNTGVGQGEPHRLGDVILLKNITEFKELDSAKTTFISTISHELKTPIMSISGYAELMMNGMVPPDKMQDFSGRIFHESERLSNLVADIIQLSRLDEKNGETMFEQVDIGELGEDVINNLQNRAAKKKINLEYTGGPAQMQGVRHVLYEMFYNITDNAIRYTPDGGDVKVFVGKLNGKPYFRVEDNGIGIPESEQQRIFERFYRVDKSHSRETGGTGLGLSIVKHGAVLHHAKILLDSEPGKGTKMEILFDQTK